MSNHLKAIITLIFLFLFKIAYLHGYEKFDRKYSYEQNRSCTNLEKNYNYKDKGPDFWRVVCDECNNGRQSPVDIQTRNAIYDESLERFKFFNYDQLIDWEFDGKFEQNSKASYLFMKKSNQLY
jgi:hypothetical protein